MRVGILTSWRVPCGIYQYSARYADGLSAIGHEPVILAGRADDHRSVPEESDHEVHNVAKIGLWRDDGQYWLQYEDFGGFDLDVIHVQYQSMLFSQQSLAEMASAFSGPVAITYHDNCQRPDFPYDRFDLHFSHRWNVGPNLAEILPFGIEDRPPIVRTFGLGRTRSDIIAPICRKNGWIFQDAASHEPIHGGGQGWQTHEQLIEWLRGADAIVLWYDDVAQAGSSQAARTAIAARRPVITNNTTWFSDLPELVPFKSAPIYTKVEDTNGLESRLKWLFYRSYVEEISWTNIARKSVIAYSKVLNTQAA